MSKKKIEHSVRTMCDAVQEGRSTPAAEASRRIWLQNFALISGSAAVAWACGSSSDNKANAAVVLTTEQMIADAKLYNAALALEHEAISVYTSAAGLGDKIWGASVSPLAPAFLAVASSFLGHHSSHRDAIITKIEAMKTVTGISAVATLSAGDYLKPYPGIGDLTGASGLLGVLQVAAEREMNAANAYFSIFNSFNDKDAIGFMGGIEADEAAHYGVLNAAAFAFGALNSLTSDITATNIVSGTRPPFVYSKAGVRATT